MKEKVIIITGASSGIGAATARLLTKQGHKVMLAARSSDKLSELADALGKNAAYHPTDVTEIYSVKSLVKATLDNFGRIDVLINNAGIGNRGNLHDGDLEAWSNMIDVNIKGVLYATRLVLPVMLDQHNGHIINVGSVASHNVYPNVSVYCATKHAVKVFSKALRLELGGKVRGTMISPGPVDTPFVDHLITEDNKEEVTEYFSSGLDAANVAEAIAYAINQPSKVAINEVIIRPNNPPAR